MIILILNRGQRGQVRLAGHSRWRLLTTEKSTNSNLDGANSKTKLVPDPALQNDFYFSV